MLHEEILGKAESYRTGTLSKTEMSEMASHLASCEACREIVGKWPDAAPGEDFIQRVMARLESSSSSSAWRPMLAPLAGVLVSMILIVAAFWHPERDWLRADKSFAKFDTNSKGAGTQKSRMEMHYE